MTILMKELTKYSGFIENSLKQKFAYKFKTFIFSISSLIFMLIQYYLWKAIFDSNHGTLYNYGFKQYIAYIGIGLLVENLTLCPQDLAVGEEVKSGSVAINLLKPFSYRRMVFARHIGEKLGDLVSLVPILLVVVLGTGVNAASGLTIIEFLISLLLAFILSFLSCYLTGILAFWVTNCWGLHYLRKSLTFLFSGHVIAIGILFQVSRSQVNNNPVSFLGEEFTKHFFGLLGHLSYCLPFQAMYYSPSAIYTGMISGQQQIWLHIALQLFWVVFLLFLTSFIWKKAQDKITILGG